MFKTILIICAPMFGDSCLKLEDDYGPYDTRGECVTSAIQMYHSTQMILPPPYDSVSYKCESSF